MKTEFTKLSIYLTLLVFFVGCSSHNLDIPRGAIDFSVEKPKSFKLANGLTVLHVEDPTLPLVTAKLFLPAGHIMQGPGEEGSFSALGSLMRSGGTLSHSPDQVERILADHAAGISVNFDSDIGELGLSSLASDLDTIMPLFLEVLLKPRFDAAKLELWKLQNLEEIARRRENPGGIAGLTFQRLMYGSSTLGLVPRSEDIKRITGSKLRQLHKEIVGPKDSVLALAGPLNESQIKQLVNRYFASWSNPQQQSLSYDGIADQSIPGVYFIEGSFTQATILMGQRGAEFLPDDWHHINIFNALFGSESSGISRLHDTVRTQLGLVYAIYGMIGQGFPGVPGRSFIWMQTKNESVDEAIDASLSVLEDMRSEAVNSEELRAIKTANENSFLFDFETKRMVLQRAAVQLMKGYPSDFDSQYLSKLASVSKSDILSVANRRFNLPDFSLVVVGNSKALEALEGYVKSEENKLPFKDVQRLLFDEVPMGL